MSRRHRQKARAIAESLDVMSRPPEPALDYDPLGRANDARAARLLASVTIRTAAEGWTVEMVRARLREAARGCERLTGRVGPANGKGFWPAVCVEFSDLVEMAASEALKDFQDSRNASAGGARDISAIENALCWPWIYLSEDSLLEPRKALQLWVWCEARRQAFEEHSKGLGCSRRTAFYRRDAAFRAILAGLERDGVRP